MDTTRQAPWLSYYQHLPGIIPYEQGSIFDAFYKTRQLFPLCPAYTFMGRSWSYETVASKVLRTAQAFAAMGIGKGDRVLLCLPNLPQTVDCVYALNYLGAVSALIHPLSTPEEIRSRMDIVRCNTAVTLDMFARKFLGLKGAGKKPVRVVMGHISDELDPVKKFFYHNAVERRYHFTDTQHQLLDWSVFMAGAEGAALPEKFLGKADDPAVILFTGGSTGTPKGALLSNLNINAEALQTIAAGGASKPGSTIVAILPMFHGFGLGVGVHAALGNGGTCILVPQFDPKDFSRLLRKQRPNFLVGVPTIYDSMIRLPGIEKVDMSCLMGAFSGGDTMTEALRGRVNDFFAAHGSTVHVREGYGMTECVAASCLNPDGAERPGSVGIPFPSMDYRIVKPGTEEEVPAGEEGEICINGPTVMLGYVDEPEATAQVLRRHSDGSLWLHSGDLGKMDKDGFVYYIQRIKRMIVTSGYNVYPGQVESVLESSPLVKCCCVIGVPDTYRGELVKAYVTLQPGVSPGEDTKRELDAHCRQRMVEYACPRAYAFADELPTTLVGKVDFMKLMQQEAAASTQERGTAQ